MPNDPDNGISPQRTPHVCANGDVTTGSLRIPYSSFASDEARRTFLTGLQPPPPESANDITALREHFVAFNDWLRDQMLATFDVTIEATSIGGVRVQRVSPTKRRDGDCRVLVNLHGGAFMWGSGSGALVEAIPIAATSGLPVIAVDYRLAPEHRFPAASDDVQRVYEALLTTTAADSIGFYGCSAGAILAAQSVAQCLRSGLPAPGSIAMLGGTGLFPAGDSSVTAPALCGEAAPLRDDAPVPALLPYFDGVALDDPHVMPGLDPHLVSRLPPSLLIAGSRDFALSSMTTMHRRLLSQRVHAELVVFDGLWHAFHIFPHLPESREVYGLLGDFFHRTLATTGTSSR